MIGIIAAKITLKSQINSKTSTKFKAHKLALLDISNARILLAKLMVEEMF